MPHLVADGVKEAEISKKAQMLVRAYDPCISYSVHWIDLQTGFLAHCVIAKKTRFVRLVAASLYCCVLVVVGQIYSVVRRARNALWFWHSAGGRVAQEKELTTMLQCESCEI